MAEEGKAVNIKSLEKRVKELEEIIVELCSYTGNNRILRERNIATLAVNK